MYHKRRENMSLLSNADNNSSANTSKNTSKKVTYKQQSAKQQWFEIEQFKWLHEVPHNANVVFYSVCNKYISVYLSYYYRHANSTMHISKCSVETSTCNVNEEVEMQTDETFLSFDDRRKSAKIRYATLISDKNISILLQKFSIFFRM